MAACGLMSAASSKKKGVVRPEVKKGVEVCHILCLSTELSQSRSGMCSCVTEEVVQDGAS